MGGYRHTLHMAPERPRPGSYPDHRTPKAIERSKVLEQLHQKCAIKTSGHLGTVCRSACRESWRTLPCAHLVHQHTSGVQLLALLGFPSSVFVEGLLGSFNCFHGGLCVAALDHRYNFIRRGVFDRESVSKRPCRTIGMWRWRGSRVFGRQKPLSILEICTKEAADGHGSHIRTCIVMMHL